MGEKKAPGPIQSVCRRLEIEVISGGRRTYMFGPCTGLTLLSSLVI
jgi:hypothetical protein